MCSLEQFKIDLKGLTGDVTPLEWDLDGSFFEQLDSPLLKQGSVHVSGSIRKASGFYELLLDCAGTVTVPCDRCLDPMELPVEANLRTVVKLGTEYTEEDDVVTVDEADACLDTAWLIYEAIALAVPIQHVHQPGDCNVLMSEKLKEFSAARSSDADANNDGIDPRWAALEKLRVKS